MLEVLEMSKRYDEVLAVDNLSLTIQWMNSVRLSSVEEPTRKASSRLGSRSHLIVAQVTIPIVP